MKSLLVWRVTPNACLRLLGITCLIVCALALWSARALAQGVSDGGAVGVSFAGEDDGLELPPGMDDDGLLDLSLKELTEIPVYSVSKKAQSLNATAAAVFVLTGEDIRRSGVTNIAEALRLVPGVNVAKLDGNKWAVSARGFNNRFANKLLVLIDGRSVYTPLFAGVFWEIQDTLIEDIDRIEVVRGPGATVWGANAVNGVINIITKRPKDTQGLLAVAGVGTEERTFFGGRFGGRTESGVDYRFYVKGFERDEQYRGNDDWRSIRGGFRSEWAPTSSDTFNLQGDLYFVEAGGSETVPLFTAPFARTVVEDSPFFGGNVLARWERQLDDESALSIQMFYDHTGLKNVSLDERRDTLDIEFQHSFALPWNQEIVWGFGYRGIIDKIDGTPTLNLSPSNRDLHLLSFFIQDEVEFIENVFSVTGGTKLELHTLSGLEVLPSGRAVFQPHEDHTLWGAVSRAVRTPSRANDDLFLVTGRVPTGPTTGMFPVIVGSGDFEPEELLAFEVGYRVQPVESVIVDIAAFYNVYDNLSTIEPGIPFVSPLLPPGDVFLPTVFDNQMEGESYGVEVASSWQPFEMWRLSAAYSFLRTELHLDSGSGDTTSEANEGYSPRNQLVVRSRVDLPGDLEFDVGLRYVDNLGGVGISNYFVADVRVGWQLPIDGQRVRLDVIAQNLFDDHHPEFAPVGQATTATETQSGVFAKLTWELE